MGINSTEVSYGFGQMGSLFNDGTAACTPPTGKVVIAILSLDNATEFNTLTGDTAGYIDGTTGAAGTGAIAYVQTTAVGANGTNADDLPASETFPAGTTIYGRWTTVQIDAGAVIMYFGNV